VDNRIGDEGIHNIKTIKTLKSFWTRKYAFKVEFCGIGDESGGMIARLLGLKTLAIMNS
jgi:hypothetical protein